MKIMLLPNITSATHKKTAKVPKYFLFNRSPCTTSKTEKPILTKNATKDRNSEIFVCNMLFGQLLINCHIRDCH